eukprot:Em0001g3615a
MQPLLNPVDQRQSDLVWIKRWNAFRRPLTSGAVVAVKSPTDPGCVLIKRVVALEGDAMETRDADSCHTIPQGHLWVEGENASNSRDSNLFGPIPQGLVMGQATHIVWPPHRWGHLEVTLSPDQIARRTRRKEE